MYHNVVAQTSQNNFLQQQQQQQQSNNQPMQSQQYYCYPTNQQGVYSLLIPPKFLAGTYSQGQYVQPYQQDPYAVNQHQQQPISRVALGNVGQPLIPTSYNPQSIMQSQALGYGSLPAHVLDQIRSYIGTPGPVFILPSNCPNPTIQPTSVSAPTNPTTVLGCPGIGINCPSSAGHGYPNGYPYPPGYFNHPGNYSAINPNKESKNCCCSTQSTADSPNNRSPNPIHRRWTSETEEHRCSSSAEDTICDRMNCPSALNLQALASQLLAIQGIISCAATRMVLRKVPGSNVTTTMDETMERAKKSLNSMNKEQLLAETRAAQQVNALINLHITANPPLNVVPVLTTLQLKVNLLRSLVDSAINRRLCENQGIVSADANGDLDIVLLAMKSDQEIRDLLGTLRQKECDERVNLNFAPYQSQRVIAEARLSSVQRKIGQIEEEMDRRRSSILPRSAMGHQVSHQYSDPGCVAWYGYPGDLGNTQGPSRLNQSYESPDPFRGIQVKSPKRLNLKPHVGSPETTYPNNDTKTSEVRGVRSRTKESDEDDCEQDNEKNSHRRETSVEGRCCNCDKSASDDDSADEGKKKLGVKIHVAKNHADDNKEESSGVSVVKLSRNVVIVIDADRDGSYRIKDERPRKELVDKGIGVAVEERENSTDPEISKITRAKSLETISSPIEKSKKKKKIEERDRSNDRLEKSGSIETLKKSDRVTKTIPESPIDEKGKTDREEPVREETVRMITNIQYEPSIFRDYREKETKKRRSVENIVKDSFADNSVKSSSNDSNFDEESLSLCVENYEEASSLDPIEDAQKNTDTFVEKDQTEGNEASKRLKKKIENRNNSSVNEDESSSNDLISGALTTIGNHVASFGSIIGKIAGLNLHRTENNSSHETFHENSTKKNNSSDEDSQKEATTSHQQSSTDNKRKEIGRWKYITFADVQESTSDIDNDENSNSNNSTYTLPKLRHSVIMNKKNGGKYVVVEEPNRTKRNLGEPYKTSRSLVIRSRLKSPQSLEKLGPFNVVKGPKNRDKNCLPLSFFDVRNLRKNRFKNNNELRTSEKFWLKPEVRLKSVKSKIMKNDDFKDDKTKHINSNNFVDKNRPVKSNETINDERVVKIHDYSNIRI